jgi:hypothetical protein
MIPSRHLSRFDSAALWHIRMSFRVSKISLYPTFRRELAVWKLSACPLSLPRYVGEYSFASSYGPKATIPPGLLTFKCSQTKQSAYHISSNLLGRSHSPARSGHSTKRGSAKSLPRHQIDNHNQICQRHSHPIRRFTHSERGAVGYHICLTCGLGYTRGSCQRTEDPRFEPGRSYSFCFFALNFLCSIGSSWLTWFCTFFDRLSNQNSLSLSQGFLAARSTHLEQGFFLPARN